MRARSIGSDQISAALQLAAIDFTDIHRQEEIVEEA
jgi:hypothetical protein